MEVALTIDKEIETCVEMERKLNAEIELENAMETNRLKELIVANQRKYYYLVELSAMFDDEPEKPPITESDDSD